MIQTTINLAKINQVIKQVEILLIRSSAEADHQSFENRAASLEHAKASRKCVSQDRIEQQVVNMNAQHDVHTVKKEQSKIIKNTVQNPIIQEKINQMRSKAKFTAFKPSRNRGKQHEWDIFLVDTQRSVPTMQKAQNTKIGEPRKDSPRCSASTRLSKIPVTVQRPMQKMLKEQKEHSDTLCISTGPVYKEKTHDQEL